VAERADEKVEKYSIGELLMYRVPSISSHYEEDSEEEEAREEEEGDDTGGGMPSGASGVRAGSAGEKGAKYSIGEQLMFRVPSIPSRDDDDEEEGAGEEEDEENAGGRGGDGLRLDAGIRETVPVLEFLNIARPLTLGIPRAIAHTPARSFTHIHAIFSSLPFSRLLALARCIEVQKWMKHLCSLSFDG